jgi:soluble lytic murein transglycosylase
MTGGPLFFKIFSLLIFTFCIQTNLLASNLPKLRKDPVLFNFKNSPKDKRLSRELHTYIRNLKKYRYDSVNIKNINFYLKHTSAFIDLNKTLKWSVGLVKLTSKSASFYTKCQKRPSSGFFEKKIIALSVNFCNRQFLKAIGSPKNRFSSKQLAHLRNNLAILLIKKNRLAFSKFLEVIKKDSQAFALISSHINNFYVENYESPTGKILQQITIDDELTTYIQNNGIDLHTSKKYFTEEFLKLIRTTRATIRKKDFKQSEVFFSQALAFYHQNKQFISPVKAWRKFLYTSQDFTAAKEFKLAHRSYQHILQICNLAHKDKTLFNMLMNSIRSNNKAMLKLTLDTHKFLDNFEDHSIKLKFWVARSMEKVGKKKTAIYLYKEIANSSSLQYYSILASRKLARDKSHLSEEEMLPKRSIANISHSFLNKQSLKPSFQTSLKRIGLWIDLGMDGLIESESKDIIKASAHDMLKSKKLSKQYGKLEFQRLVFKELINLYNQRGKFLQTFKLVYKAINSNTYDINDKSLRVLFPFRYIKKIQRYSKKIDPILILALIRQESAFNPRARSHAGARGLMQLMPATAKRYKRHLKAHQLEEPNLNLRIGITYLRKLLKKYNGNLIQTLSAYNAGERRVSQWMGHVFNEKDPLFAIESIPFKETRDYVKYIYRNIYFYKYLTKDLKMSEPLNETFRVRI